MNTTVIRSPTGGGSFFSVLLPNVIYLCCVTLCSEGKSHDVISKRMGTAAMISYCSEIMGYLFNNVAIVLQGLIAIYQFTPHIHADKHRPATYNVCEDTLYIIPFGSKFSYQSKLRDNHIIYIYISNHILIILNNVCCATYTLVHDVIANRIRIDIYDEHIFHCCLCEAHDTNTPSCLVIGNYTKGMGCRFLSQLLILDNWLQSEFIGSWAEAATVTGKNRRIRCTTPWLSLKSWTWQVDMTFYSLWT